MKLKRLYIPDYFILKDFNINFMENLSVIIGENGSGKSSIIEVLAYIFGHLHKYFVLGDKTAEFIDNYEIEYDTMFNELEYSIYIKSQYVNQKTNTFNPIIKINQQAYTISQIDDEFGGFANFLPSKVILYYSGVTEHLRQLNDHFAVKYRNKLIKEGNQYTLTPLLLPAENPFIYVGKEYLPILLVSLLLIDTPQALKLLKLLDFDFDGCELSIILHRPEWAKTDWNELWGIRGSVSEAFIQLLTEHAISTTYQERGKNNERELVRFDFVGQVMIQDLFANIDSAPKTAFSIFDMLLCSDLLHDINITWKKNQEQISIDRLSEGQKQLLLTWGTSMVWGEKNLLFLYDEPDVSLHPKWQRDFVPNFHMALHQLSSAVITTHSPILLSNAAKVNVHIMHEGHRIEITPKYYGKDISAILYELMGVTSRIPEIEKKLTNLFKEIDQEEKQRAQEQYNELLALLGENDKDLVYAKVLLDDLMY